MAEQKPEVKSPRFNYGDRVKIRFSGGLSGRIVKLRGPPPQGLSFTNIGPTMVIV